MEWLDNYLDRLLNPTRYAQFPDFKQIETESPRVKDVNSFVGNEQSKNIEDRRGNFTEEDRIKALWTEEQERVNKVLGNSILRRWQSPTDAFGPEGQQPDMFGVMESVKGR